MNVILLAIGILCLLLSGAVNYVAKCKSQKRNVARLVDFGGHWNHRRFGKQHNIRVWYSSDLRWISDDRRYEVVWNTYSSGLPAWICRSFGVDFASHPVALEIDLCDWDNNKTFADDEFTSIIGDIATIKQMWINERSDSNGNIINELSNNDLKKLFPDIIVASPQPSGEIIVIGG